MDNRQQDGTTSQMEVGYWDGQRWVDWPSSPQGEETSMLPAAPEPNIDAPRQLSHSSGRRQTDTS